MFNNIIGILEARKIKFKMICFNYEDQKFNCLLIGDKIVFILEFETDGDIDEYVSRIPALRQGIQEEIGNSDSLKVNLNNNYSLSGFLWDIYVVAICNYDNKIDNLIINKLENDTFVAKKIIIKYKNIDDLIEKFISNILPDKRLSDLIANEKTTNNTINNALNFEDEKDKTKLILKFLLKKEGKIDLQLIDEYLDKLIKEEEIG